MNLMTQFTIILSILFGSDLIIRRFNLNIPSAVLGMIVLFILLLFKIIKLEWVQDISDLLTNNLSIMFIPIGVGMMNETHIFKNNLIGLIITIIVSTLIVMIVTGKTLEYLLKKGKSDRDG